MYIVTGKNGTNIPLNLDEAIRHVCNEMYMSQGDKEKAKLHFANGGSIYGIAYGFIRLDIEKV
jgi:hypothetical protein